jgi:hypothetical protein
MKRTMKNLLQAIAIVRQLRARPTSWLSDVGRGPIEKTGTAIAIKRSVRGLSIRLDNGSVVAWSVPAAVARLVCQWCVMASTPIRFEFHPTLPFCSGFAKAN